MNEKRHRIHPIIRQRSRELRQPQTPSETMLWQHLRNRKSGYKFRRQHPIARFIIDFYCAETKLCIELDGSQHFEPEQLAYDRARTDYLEELGYTVIRFQNHEVEESLNRVLEKIRQFCKES